MESLSCMAISTAKRGLLHLNLWAVCHCVAERFTVFVLVLDCVMHYKIDSTGGTRVDLILSEGALMPLQAWNGLDDFGKVVSKHGSSAAIFVIFRDSRGSCSRPAFARNMPDFKLAVDKNNKATELALLRVCGTVQQNPHMRAFWASTISCFLAFLAGLPWHLWRSRWPPAWARVRINFIHQKTTPSGWPTWSTSHSRQAKRTASKTFLVLLLQLRNDFVAFLEFAP